jgi:hypothetical protein
MVVVDGAIQVPLAHQVVDLHAMAVPPPSVRRQPHNTNHFVRTHRPCTRTDLQRATTNCEIETRKAEAQTGVGHTPTGGWWRRDRWTERRRTPRLWTCRRPTRWLAGSRKARSACSAKSRHPPPCWPQGRHQCTPPCSPSASAWCARVRSGTPHRASSRSSQSYGAPNTIRPSHRCCTSISIHAP